MKSMEVISAAYNEETGFIEVAKEIVNDDDSVEYMGHSFHPETVEWIGAIYDTKDMDEIIDLILYEPHVENVDPMSMNAEEAKELHNSKINDFKTNNKKVNPNRKSSLDGMREKGIHEKFINDTDSPYDVIKGKCHIDEEVFKAKKEHISRMREEVKHIPKKVLGMRDAKDRIADLNRNNRAVETKVKDKIIEKPMRPPIILERGRRVKK